MIEKDSEKLQQELSPEEYYVTQEKGTEPCLLYTSPSPRD